MSGHGSAAGRGLGEALQPQHSEAGETCPGFALQTSLFLAPNKAKTSSRLRWNHQSSNQRAAAGKEEQPQRKNCCRTQSSRLVFSGIWSPGGQPSPTAVPKHLQNLAPGKLVGMALAEDVPPFFPWVASVPPLPSEQSWTWPLCKPEPILPMHRGLKPTHGAQHAV